MINSCSAARTTSATLSATPATLILGCRSYVATLGESIRCRCSFSNCFSTPPLKKNVTCAYFSVSVAFFFLKKKKIVSSRIAAQKKKKLLTGDVRLFDLVLGEPFS